MLITLWELMKMMKAVGAAVSITGRYSLYKKRTFKVKVAYDGLGIPGCFKYNFVKVLPNQRTNTL